MLQHLGEGVLPEEAESLWPEPLFDLETSEVGCYSELLDYLLQAIEQLLVVKDATNQHQMSHSHLIQHTIGHYIKILLVGFERV